MPGAGKMAVIDASGEERVVVRLRRPVHLGQQVFEELRLRRPVAGDLRGVDMRPEKRIDLVLALASKLAGIPPQAVDRLDFADFSDVSEAIGNFLEAGGLTGKSDSAS